MAATSAEIESCLDLIGDFSLITGAATITDNSAWGSIGVATPDTVKILLRILDPTGDVFYENAGWNTGVYTSPDLQLTDTTYTFTLPTDIAGDYITGQYTVYTKCQVVEGSDTTVVTKTFYQNVVPQCNDITLSVEGQVVAGTTEVKLTDNTNYKTYTSLSRVMILYPPPPSGQASQTGTNVDTIVYSGTVYTGVWTWKITSDVTFTDIDGVSTTCRLTGQGTFNVQQSQLCKVLCLLEKYRTQVLSALAQKNGTVLLNNYLLAMTEYQFATNGYVCGKSQTVIDAHIQKIYDITGIDPDCDCGCDGGVSAPLLSVTTVDGTDGTDGSLILYGSGAPASGTGSVGDTYINTANGFVYKKTGATTWTYELTIIGVGATGATGASGSSLIYSNGDDKLTTTNGAFETIRSFTTDHTEASKNLVNVGDTIRIYGLYYVVANPMTPTIPVQFIINGTGLSNLGLSSLTTISNSNTSLAEICCDIILTDNTAGAMYIRVNTIFTTWGAGSFNFNSLIFTTKLTPIDLGGATVDFSANDYTISAQAQSVTTGDIGMSIYQAEKLKLGGGTTTIASITRSAEFLIIAATTSYTFDGSVTAFNADGITLIGKSVVDFILDGLSKSLLLSEYTFDTATGIITIPTAATGAGAKIIYV